MTPTTPKVTLAETIAKGLAPRSETFKDNIIKMGWDSVAVEKLLLEDKEQTQLAHKLVIEALARLGPMSIRQLVFAIGLSEDLLKGILEEPARTGGYPNGKLPEQAYSLLATKFGIITRRGFFVYSLTKPDELRQRQQQVVEEIRGYLRQAVQAVADVKEVLVLAAPFCADVANVCPNPTPTGDACKLFEHLQALDLVPKGQSAESWVASWSSKDAGDRWSLLPVRLASRVHRALSPITGYECLLHEMNKLYLSFRESVTAQFYKTLFDGFGGLVSNGWADRCRCGQHNPEKTPLCLVTELESTKAQQMSDLAIAQLEEAIDSQYRQGSEIWQEVCPIAQAVADSLSNTEKQLEDSQTWADHLDSVYKLPSKILHRLCRLQEEGQDAVAIAEKIRFTGITAEVAKALRAFVIAKLNKDAAGQEATARTFFALKREGVLGRDEFGEATVPGFTVTRNSSCHGGNYGHPCIEEERFRNASWDADHIRDAMGIRGFFDDEFRCCHLISEMKTKMQHDNDRLFEDCVIARMQGDKERLQKLQLEFLVLFSKAQVARRDGKLEQNDAILSDSCSSPNLKCTGLEWKDLNNARDLVWKLIVAKAWARRNTKSLPLSLADCEEALKVTACFGDTYEAQDWSGLDCHKIALHALKPQRSIVTAEDLRHLLG